MVIILSHITKDKSSVNHNTTIIEKEAGFTVSESINDRQYCFYRDVYLEQIGIIELPMPENQSNAKDGVAVRNSEQKRDRKREREAEKGWEKDSVYTGAHSDSELDTIRKSILRRWYAMKISATHGK